MKAEDYIEWVAGLPVPEVPEVVEVRWLMRGGLSILIAARPLEEACLVIEFTLAQAFQAKDEGYRLVNVSGRPGLIWQVSNSSYLRAFRDDAATTMDNFPLLHWVVMSNNQCVDVLSENAPILRAL